jgi:hypothetical protein
MDGELFGQKLVNQGLHEIIKAKQERINIGNTDVGPSAKGGIPNELILRHKNNALAKQLEEANAALAQANELVADWQSAMEAWKDLAVTLREEIKACPNHEAHKFGKDKDARVEHFNKKETEERVKRKLKPKQYK